VFFAFINKQIISCRPPYKPCVFDYALYTTVDYYSRICYSEIYYSRLYTHGPAYLAVHHMTWMIHSRYVFDTLASWPSLERRVGAAAVIVCQHMLALHPSLWLLHSCTGRRCCCDNMPACACFATQVCDCSMHAQALLLQANTVYNGVPHWKR
jgi:hypothetical protein